ncbi:hypothetical protein [Motilimonas eburnea]|uniref:hypothetical protein n=1 Tax=Motilimonas eburnea TaxID=1737488 RepID=UPI001E65AC9E|nr:hypothetical protein [Motilimonas eburnea]MCE2571335.1 hypothetical protein [Motilimonas eburnea]
MRFSLPQQTKSSLPLLLEQLNEHINVHKKVSVSLLKQTLDTCFSSGFTLDEVEKALQCEVNALEQAEIQGVQQLIKLIQQRQL